MKKITREEYQEMLKDCGLLMGFQVGSSLLINNFLHDLSDDRVRPKATDQKGQVFYQTNYYDSIEPFVVEEVIKLDNLLRLSTQFNDKPIVVYRGNPTLTSGALSGIVSTSMDIDIAKEFYSGSLIKMELPAGFPYIMMNDVTGREVFEHEQEVILPPCTFKVSETFTLPHQDFPTRFPDYYKGFVVKVEPKDLAQTMLERMKNPPKDYDYNKLPDYRQRYKQAMKLLQDYVKAYVNKNKFLTDSQPENQ